MTTALQQQVFALDAKYNTHRAPNNLNFKTLYIRRRSQLLRETERDPEKWKQYLKVRAQLLQRRYGIANNTIGESFAGSASSNSLCRLSISNKVVPTNEATASRALVGNTSIADNYAFKGVYHIFDQHSKEVTMVKFANNDRSRLCCASTDNKLSICCLTDKPPSVIALLEGHSDAVTGLDWSQDNDLIASCSLDGSVKIWTSCKGECMRTFLDPNQSQICCCLFQPSNNNLLLVGTSSGDVRNINVSTGRFLRHFSRIGGRILALTTCNSGNLVFVGNDRGEIISLTCSPDGNLTKAHRIQLPSSNNNLCKISSLSYKTWISREARDPLLLVNASCDSLFLFRVEGLEGGLHMKKQFFNRHRRSSRVSSTFCPLTSFRPGACIVTGSEDGCVYFLDVEKQDGKNCVNTLQGHAVAVTGISFSYDESLLATADTDGLVIVWKRTNFN